MIRLMCVCTGLMALALYLTPARADDGGWGSVTGHVVFGGDSIPAAKPIDVNKDKGHCESKGMLVNEEWVINPSNKGVRWAFVWLAPFEKGGKLPIHPKLKDAPTKPIEIDQPTCRFEPHAAAVREGQTVIAKNSAPIPHNVHWTGNPVKNPGGNVLLPTNGQQVIDLKADRIPIKVVCDIHPWMSAWLRVFDHPYYAVTDADGAFELKDAPAGEYRLMVWHEAVGFGPGGRDGIKITIKANQPTDAGKLPLKP